MCLAINRSSRFCNDSWVKLVPVYGSGILFDNSTGQCLERRYIFAPPHKRISDVDDWPSNIWRRNLLDSRGNDPMVSKDIMVWRVLVARVSADHAVMVHLSRTFKKKRSGRSMFRLGILLAGDGLGYLVSLSTGSSANTLMPPPMPNRKSRRQRNRSAPPRHVLRESCISDFLPRIARVFVSLLTIIPSS